MLTIEEFFKINEDELYIGMVRPFLQNLEKDVYRNYQKDLKEQQESILYVEKFDYQKEGFTKEEWMELEKNTFDLYCHSFFDKYSYASIIWKKQDGSYFDCNENIPLDKKEVLEEYLIPFSMFYKMEEIKVLSYKDKYCLTEDSYEVYLPIKQFDGKMQDALSYLEEKYKKERYESYRLTEKEKKEIITLAEENRTTTYEMEMPIKGIAPYMENIYLAMIGNGRKIGATFIEKYKEEDEEFYFNLITYDWVDLTQYYLRDLEPFSWYYNETEFAVVEVVDQETQEKHLSLQVTTNEPLLAYFESHKEEKEKRDPLVYQKRSSNYFS